MKYSRDLGLIAAFCAALLIMIWSTFYVIVQKGRNDAVEEAYRDSYTSAAVFAEQATRTFRSLDSVMQLVAYEVGKSPTPDRLKSLVDEKFITMDTLVLFTFVDQNGVVQGSNLGPDPARTNLADREHIRVHLDGKVQGLFIGKPVLGRVSGKWSIQLTRRVSAPDGSLAGVLVASVDPHYFERFWRSLAGNRQDVTELIGLDGVLRARSVDVEGALATHSDRRDVIERTNDRAVGRYVARDEAGGDRLTSIVRLEDLPLVVADGVSKAAVLAELGPMERSNFLIAAGTTIIVLAFGAMLGHLATRLRSSIRQANEAENRLAEAIEAIPEGFALFDPDDRLVVFNHAYRRVYATTSDLIEIGTKFEDLLRKGVERGQYHSATGREEEWIRDRLAQHRNPVGPVEQITDAGQWLRIEEKKTADGGVVGIRADITELKQRQIELAKQTTLLQATLRHMGEGIAVYDAERRLIAWNELCVDLLKLPDWLVSSETSLDEIAKYRARRGDFGDTPVEAVVSRMIDEFQSGDVVIGEWRGADGRVIETRRNSMPNGGAVELYRDITARKEAEERIDQALRDAEAASRAKSEFLALISHEIRTPMNAVIGMSSLLTEANLQPEHARLATAIESAGERLLVIVNDLLDFSSLEAGRLALEQSPFDIRQVIDSAMEIARALPAASNLHFSSAVDPDVPQTLVGDSGRINQILLNLLGNAVKFTERGGARVAVSLTDRYNDRATLRCVVTDTGTGIPQELRRRLFQPFEQGSAGSQRGAGAGLGLAICRKLVELMGGAIEVESQPGEGSSFAFAIPCGIAAASPIDAKPERAAAPGARRLRVLVAEDVPANQVVARSILESLGHRVQVASNGAEAITMAREADFDVILMDIQMPVVDGLQAIREIRRLEDGRGRAPIIALTALAQQNDMADARRAGADGFLTKPIRKRDLAAALEPYCGASHPARVEGEQNVLAMDMLDEMREDLGLSSFREFLDKCQDNIATRLERVEAALRANTPDVARATAHQLRGLFGQFGARQAAEAAGLVEGSEAADMQDRIAVLRAEANSAVAALEKVGRSA